LVSISKLAGTLRASREASWAARMHIGWLRNPLRLAAHAPGLTVSPLLLAHVDEVIEQGLVHGLRSDIGASSHWRAEARVRSTA